MKYEIINSEFLNEKEYIFNLENGLKIIVVPKKGFSKTAAMFAVNFGSTVNTFKTKGEKDFTKIPDGVAHFLEHKLFESEEGDAFSMYAKTGASANAYTSFNVTNYYFSCTDKLKENLKILINLMQTPYFTKENVDKEQGIIGQEINMYLDNPGWRVYFNMLEAMYVENPVRCDIAGSVESIAKITPELLYDCYNRFYNPENMVLSICGDVDPVEIAEYASSLITGLGNIKDTEVLGVSEPQNVLKNKVTQPLSVSMPLFNIGFKDTPPKKGKDIIRKEIIGRMALDLVFGKSGKFFDENYNSGLINDSYDIEYECEPNFCHSMIAGESENPDLVLENVLKYADEIRKKGFSDEEIKCQINIEKSIFIKDFNSVEGTARNIMEAYFGNYNIFDYLEIADTITKDDILKQLETFTKDNAVLSVIEVK